MNSVKKQVRIQILNQAYDDIRHQAWYKVKVRVLEQVLKPIQYQIFSRIVDINSNRGMMVSGIGKVENDVAI